MSDKISLLASTAIVATALAIAPAAYAQDASTSQQTQTSTTDKTSTAGQSATDTQSNDIVVTGLRQSLENAANLKRNSDQIQDSIVAEDIGKLPDTNIAETLQRIPGVQISRNTRGEGNAYEVHGLKQVMTTVNGRHLFTVTNRTAPLLDFSADILSGLDVYKTATADQIEGGLGGLINIHTARPFDFKGAHLAMTGSFDYSQFLKKASPRISGVVSDRWQTGMGEFGILLGGQYERIYSAGYHSKTNTYGDNTSLFDVNGNGQTGDAADTVTIPSQVALEYETGNRVRTALYGALQWAPSPDLTFHLDLLRTHSGGHSETKSLAVKTSGATGIGTPTFKSGSTVPETYSLSNPQVQSVTGYADNPYNTFNVAFGVNYNSGPLSLSAEASYVKSKGPFYYRAVTLSTSATRADISLQGDTPDFALQGAHLTDPAAYASGGYFEFGNTAEGTEPSFRADAKYEITSGPITAIMAGVRWTRHRAIYNVFSNGASGPLTTSIASATSLTPDNLFTDQDMSTNQWLAISDEYMIDRGKTRELVGLAPGDPGYGLGNYYNYLEKTLAGYVEAQFAFNLGNLPVDGNFGLRAVRTDGTQLVYVQDTNGVYQPLSGGTPYENYLPSVNIRFKITPDFFLRLAYSKAITRPDYNNLSPALILNPVSLTGSGGNPSLGPTKADQYDASLEYYFGRSNYVSVALFQKNVSGFIQKFYADETINGDTYSISRPRNSGKGIIRGFEITYQQFFDFLPGALSGLGIQGNYTYVDSGLDVVGIPERVPADQLSKNAFNVTGIYEKGPISVHVSYNWRSRSVSSNSAAANGTLWNAPQKSLDISATYSINDHFSIKADVVNATIAYQNQYYGTTARPTLADQLDRQFRLGAHVNF